MVWLGVLGPLSVRVGDREPPITAGRQRVVLATLALHANQVVSLDRLTDTIWDGAPPPAAAVTVRNYIRRLRQLLGPEVAARLVTRAPGYLLRLDDTIELDVGQFEQLAVRADAALRAADWPRARELYGDALALWRGRALIDVASDRLRREHVPRLREARLRATEGRVEADLWLGKDELVIPELLALTTHNPLRERLHAQLMLALARCGRQAEALDVFQQVRRQLVDELGVEPGPLLREAQRRVLDGDTRPVTDAGTADAADAKAGTAPDSGTTAANVASGRRGAARVPRQLPADTASFVGRAAEVDALLALAAMPRQAGVVLLSAIDGMAGVGKTALAVHVAHLLAERFPDGQLFVDLHGYTPDLAPMTAGEAIDWLLRALGVAPASIPADEQARAACYRDRLAGTRTLIVLDNANSAAQIRPLIPGAAGCLVLVTSRRGLAGLDDALTLPLDVLPAAHAVTLFAAVAGAGRVDAGDPTVAEIVELCGRLPLAVRVVGARLRHHPHLSVRQLRDELREEHRRLSGISDGDRDLTAAFDLSYTHLSEAEQAMFRAVGLVPGPEIDGYAAAALTGISVAEAERLLDALFGQSLLLRPVSGRYGCHDLLRLHARAHADAELSAACRDVMRARLFDYYLSAARLVDARLARSRPAYPTRVAHPPRQLPDIPDQNSALAWGHAELPNLLAVIDAAATETAAADEGGRLVVALSAALASYLDAAAHAAQARELHGVALSAARAGGDQRGMALALTNLGKACWRHGDMAAAVDACERAVALFRATDDAQGLAVALDCLGSVRYRVGEHLSATAALERALELYEGFDDLRGQAAALRCLGIVRRCTGDYAVAVELFERALDLDVALGDRRAQAATLSSLGIVWQRAEDYPAARAAFARALDLFTDIDEQRGRAGAMTNLGIVSKLLGDLPAAEASHHGALEVFAAMNDEPGQATVLDNLGTVWHAQGRHAEAAAAFTRAVELFTRAGEPRSLAEVCNHQAALLRDADGDAAAEARYLTALELVRQLNAPAEEADALAGLADIHLVRGATETGLEYLRAAIERYERLGVPAAARLRTRLAERS